MIPIRGRTSPTSGGFSSFYPWGAAVGVGGVCLLAFNRRLRREVRERQEMEDDLRMARNEAVAANRAKSVFLANMSHELRTPLNAILGFARILQKKVSPEQRDGLQVIQKSGEHLLSLISDMLDLAKVESGRIQLEPTNFHFPEFLGAIGEMLRPRFQEKGLFFQLQTEAEQLPDWVFADERRIRQVLLNLLGNAHKFTKTGGVTLRVVKMEIPPSEVLTNLLDLVETGDLSALEETLAEMATGTPRFAPFVDRLGTMVRRFEMNRIRTLLRECME